MQSSQVSCIEGESHAFQCNFTLSCSHKYFSRISTLLQGSPKCGIVGGDKTEVEGEIGASREDPGACSPGKILKIYNT